MGNGQIRRYETRPFVIFILWCGVIVLAIIGVAAATGRGVFPTDFAARAEPIRQQFLHSLQRNDPFALHRQKELLQVDKRFAAHPLLTLLHIFPGAVFITAALFQFSSRIRTRHIQFHRWSGRILVFTGFICGLAGFFFGLLMPYGGQSEALANPALRKSVLGCNKQGIRRDPKTSGRLSSGVDDSCFRSGHRYIHR